MINIFRSLFMIAAAVAVIGGGTYSYFSATDTASGTLSAGELTVDLLNQNTSDPLEFQAEGLVPGGTTTVNFDVKNGGSANIPVNLRGFASGEWDDVEDPDNTLIKVVKVERWNSGWETLADNPSGINGIFYYSPTGADVDLFQIPADGLAQFKLTVKLDESAGDKYQGEVYNGTITVQTKQATAPTWPADMSGY